MRVALVNGRIFTQAGLLRGHTLLLNDARIEALVTPDDPRCRDARVEELGGHLVVPGFIDTQVNGGAGVLFNDDPDSASVQAIGAAHRLYGTTGFLPTLISDDL